MPQLVAQFKIDIPGQCFVALPDDQYRTFRLEIEGFDIEVRPITNCSWSLKCAGEEHKTRGFDRAVIKVSREEVELPPPVLPNSEGHLDYTIQEEYFEKRIDQFAKIAREAINRMIRFFKFSLQTPLLRELSADHQCFRNPDWTDENDKIIGKARVVIVAERVPGLWGELGVKKLTPDRLGALVEFLARPTGHSLTAQLLSEAQSAWFEGNLRRSVLELAIACEVTVKRLFFSTESPAGAAFDYLEDKGKVNIRVIELADKVAQEAFGRSYRVESPDDYKNIDNLFRCRNKVVHRGELTFKDDPGNFIAADANMVASWSASVAALAEWIATLREQPIGL